MDLDRIIADLEELSEELLQEDRINTGQSYALGFAIGIVEAMRERIEK
ncbi:MAG: hypothetical protein IKJ82_08790 [Oscillospiraceae bacterium]|nr:hypothetical protein [Oscillospiraceae bacterium]